MTVAELIAELQKMPQDWKIMAETCYDECHFQWEPEVYKVDGEELVLYI